MTLRSKRPTMYEQVMIKGTITNVDIEGSNRIRVALAETGTDIWISYRDTEEGKR